MKIYFKSFFGDGGKTEGERERGERTKSVHGYGGFFTKSLKYHSHDVSQAPFYGQFIATSCAC